MEGQAIARCHRRGQKNEVKVFYLRYKVFADSKWIDDIHERKRQAKNKMYMQYDDTGEGTDALHEADLARLYDHMAAGDDERGVEGTGL